MQRVSSLLSNASNFASESKSSKYEAVNSKEDEYIDNGKWWQNLQLRPLHPSSFMSMLFNLLAATLLFYDSMTVPYALAWDVSSDALDLMTWVTTVFWSIDLCLNFGTSYHSDEGELVTQFRSIAKHYLTTWFLIDIFSLSLDWVGLLAQAIPGLETQGGGFLRVLRFAKLSRMVRLFVKLRSGYLARVEKPIVRAARDMGLDLAFYVQCAKLAMTILMISHWGACLWYVCGSAHGFTGAGVSWQLELSEEIETSSFYMYTYGLYWGVSTMFSGNSFLVPLNFLESFCCQVYIIFGALFVSLFTSTLAANLIQEQLSHREEVESMNCLSMFLEQHKVHDALSSALYEAVTKTFSDQEELNEPNVSSLSRLHTAILSELRQFLYHAAFQDVGLFRICCKFDSELVKRCCKCCSYREVMTGEDIFGSGQDIDHLYMVLSGSVVYIRAPHVLKERVVSSMSQKIVLVKKFLCEMAFCTDWTSLGSLKADSPSYIAQFPVDGLHHAFSALPYTARLAAAYCTALVDLIRQTQPAELDDLNLGISEDAVVGSLKWTHLRSISLKLLPKVENSWKFMWGSSNQLRAEIEKGSCFLLADAQGTIVRTVQLAVLKFKRADDRALVSLGCWDKSMVTAKIQLPGSKKRHSETFEECRDRIIQEIQESLEGICEICSFDGQQVSEELRPSPTFGMDTKYVKRTFLASVNETTETSSLQKPRAAEESILGDWNVFTTQSSILHSLVSLWGWVPEHEMSLLADDSEKEVLEKRIESALLEVSQAEV